MRPHPSRRQRLTPEIPSPTPPNADGAESPTRLVLLPDGITRRLLLKAGTAGATALAAGLVGLTPTVADADDLTPSLTEGPYFKPNSPERTDLRTDGVTGVYLDLTGLVTDVNDQPVANALLDFWHADMNGNYSTATDSDPTTLVGYELRGHQYTADDGTYQLQTIIPGHYVGRTLHIHVKVQAPSSSILTTQLFFPDDTHAYDLDIASLNAQDGIYNALCVIVLNDASETNGFPYYTGTFHFVVPTTTTTTSPTPPTQPTQPGNPTKKAKGKRRRRRR